MPNPCVRRSASPAISGGARPSPGHHGLVRRPFLLTPRPEVTEAQIAEVVQRLPMPVTAEVDLDTKTLVVQWHDADASAINASHALLSSSNLFFAGPGSEEAVRRYLPVDDRPASWASWDRGQGWQGICERCGWGVSAVEKGALDAEIWRHDRDVHGGS